MIIHYRFADEKDLIQYFEWANDLLVRENSFNSNVISIEDHEKWFFSKLKDSNCFLYFFYNETNEPLGQVRIERKESETVIGISIDQKFRGKSLATKFFLMATDDFFSNFPQDIIHAYIKQNNISIKRILQKAGFEDETFHDMDGIQCILLKKQKKNN